MYPNLYYVFKDWFGVEVHALSFLNTFGLMVALSFIIAAVVLSRELKRKEKQGLLHPREELIMVGKPASFSELLFNGLIGFIFGYKIFGIFLSKPESVNAQEYIFSSSGSILGGIIGAALLAGLKWWEKNKDKLDVPEKRSVRIWPHDRVGDIIILGLIFGILGAKLFDNLEHWDQFVADPIGSIFSASGLTFYGGLILATVAICWYAIKKGIRITHLMDSAAPALMIAYAIGRIGCQVSGDGDWGVFNSAYVSDEQGNVRLAGDNEYRTQLQKYSTYFLEGKTSDSANREVYVTDRIYPSLEQVPSRHVKGASFLPDWLFAYSYPGNVNKDGISMPGNRDEHNRVLPQPVFPTPLYEFIICTALFFLMWALRSRIKVPLMMFGLYLMLNGAERFFIERIRVNKLYHFLGFESTQAEVIAVGLFLTGLAVMVAAKMYNRKLGSS
ncbi:MAG: diacylglyceryl transferase [Chitinophagaceae bacterium]|nr:MAG: diacylglyceryl transferase [Chitinophagaceae bacterium]